MPRYSTVERAFQIVQAGGCASINDLRDQLAREGYMDGVAQTSFPSIRKQLKTLIHAGLATPLAPPPAKARRHGVLRMNFEQA